MTASPCASGTTSGRDCIRGRCSVKHELAAGEILARPRQQDRDLERKDMLAVDILVERVPVARFVTQQQRRRAGLPGCVASRDEVGVTAGIAVVPPSRLRPAVGDRGQRRIERGSQPGDRRRAADSRSIGRRRGHSRAAPSPPRSGTRRKHPRPRRRRRKLGGANSRGSKAHPWRSSSLLPRPSRLYSWR